MTKSDKSAETDDIFMKHLDERCRQINLVDETIAEDVRGIDMWLLAVVFVGLPVLIAILTAFAV